jgi:hypothetical protein
MRETLQRSYRSVFLGLQLLKEDNGPTRDLVKETGWMATFMELKNDTNAQKDEYRIWLINQGFADLAKGVESSLERAYLLMWLLSNVGSNVKTLGDLKKHLHKLKYDIKISTMLKEIDKYSSKEIVYKSEIESINKARNCLVHEKGVVSDEILIICWINFKGDKVKTSFKRGERIIISHEQLKELIFTCMLFAEDLAVNIPTLKNKGS